LNHEGHQGTKATKAARTAAGIGALLRRLGLARLSTPFSCGINKILDARARRPADGPEPA
jgi:hypothetical protein